MRALGRTAVFASAAAVGMVLAAACARGDPPKTASADDWVADVCDAAVTLGRSETDAFDAYMETSGDDGEAVRDAFSTYLDDYGKALDRFSRTSGRAGRPDIDRGKEVAEAVQQWVSDEKRSLSRAERAVKALKVSGASLADEVDGLFFDREFTDFEELLDDTDSKDSDDIADLVRDDEECAAMLFAQ